MRSNDLTMHARISLTLLATVALLATPGVAAAKAKGGKKAASAAAEPKPATATPAAATPPPAAALPVPPAPPPTPGRIEFGPAGAGMGTLVVKGANLEITFEGRDFGTAPLTIYNVPKGDYIVEGTTDDDKEVSRPVTIEENVEAVVDLGAAVSEAVAKATATAAAQDDDHPRLRRASHILLGVSAAALAVGLTFGVLELKAHSDYESAPADQAKLDSLAATGHRDALIANIGFAACGVSLIAAGLTALPSFLHSEHPAAAQPTTTAFTVAPVFTRGGAMAGASFRF